MGSTKDQVSRPCEINDSFDWQVAIMTSLGRQVDISGNQTRGNKAQEHRENMTEPKQDKLTTAKRKTPGLYIYTRN